MLEQYPRLFAVLESVYPVQFVPEAGGNGIQARLVFARTASDVTTQQRDVPSLILIEDRDNEGDLSGVVVFADSHQLDEVFRDRRLVDSRAGSLRLPEELDNSENVLATGERGPLWVAYDGEVQVSAGWPEELGAGESLREHLTSRRFIRLLPLAHFLDGVCRDFGWELPETKAGFVFDDPNLHWWSYGFADYRALAAHAQMHDYHVTMATIPFDTWYTHDATLAYVQQHQERISFAVHGNNHTRDELRRVGAPTEADALARQALERTDRLRRRGLAVSRVMVPPHGTCSPVMLAALARTGFDALCADWPYWWMEAEDAHAPTAGWLALDQSNGLPIIPRHYAAAQDLDDLTFRAFLHQPLIFYGHHTDLRSGLDLLSQSATVAKSLGVKSWGSLGDIGRDVYSSCTISSHVSVQLHSRVATLNVGPTVTHAEFDVPGAAPDAVVDVRDADGVRRVKIGEVISVHPGAITVSRPVEASHGGLPNRTELRAVLRRLLSEGRDRGVAVSRRRPSGD